MFEILSYSDIQCALFCRLKCKSIIKVTGRQSYCSNTSVKNSVRSSTKRSLKLQNEILTQIVLLVLHRPILPLYPIYRLSSAMLSSCFYCIFSFSLLLRLPPSSRCLVYVPHEHEHEDGHCSQMITSEYPHYINQYLLL